MANRIIPPEEFARDVLAFCREWSERTGAPLAEIVASVAGMYECPVAPTEGNA